MASFEEKALSDGDDGPPPDVPITIPDEHYAAIGRIADAWADLEFEVDQLIWYLLGTNQALGACVTAQMISIHPKLSAMRSLVDLWQVERRLASRVATFSGDVEAMSTRRNRLIHDKRLIRWKTKEVVRFEVTARRELQFGPVVESIDELDRFRDAVASKATEFQAIRHDVMRDTSSPERERHRLPHIMDVKAPI